MSRLTGSSFALALLMLGTWALGSPSPSPPLSSPAPGPSLPPGLQQTTNPPIALAFDGKYARSVMLACEEMPRRYKITCDDKSVTSGEVLIWDNGDHYFVLIEPLPVQGFDGGYKFDIPK